MIQRKKEIGVSLVVRLTNMFILGHHFNTYYGKFGIYYAAACKQ
jgi:hypothetical protein